MGSNTSIGRGPAHGSNENHDGDPTHKTLGEGASQDEPPAGSPEGPNVAQSPSEPEPSRGNPPKKDSQPVR